MADGPIRLFPDPILRQSSAFVRQFGPSLNQIIKRMTDIMRKQPSGIGIAAPQIGIAKRIAIVDVSARDKSARKLHFINPEIMACEKEISSREGCMSLPEYTATIKRYDRVKVKWQDEMGNIHEKWFRGIESRCIQHEIDHLNGMLFIDRVTSLKTDIKPRHFKS